MGRGEKLQRRQRKPYFGADANRNQPKAVIYLTVEESITLHGEMMGIAGEASADFVRDWNLLDSALARPQNAALYEAANLARQAATLLWGIVKNHPFVDGNKRAAHMIATTFVEVNGHELVATEDEEFDLLVRAANGELDLGDVEAWFEKHVVPRRKTHQ